MFTINPMSRQPVYEQLMEQIERFIFTGGLEPGQQLPSVRSLSVMLSVNPNTIQKAYSEMDRRGLLVSVPGKGCYVADDAAGILGMKNREKAGGLLPLLYELALAGVLKEDVLEAVEKAYARAYEWQALREDGRPVSFSEFLLERNGGDKL